MRDCPSGLSASRWLSQTFEKIVLPVALHSICHEDLQVLQGVWKLPSKERDDTSFPVGNVSPYHHIDLAVDFVDSFNPFPLHRLLHDLLGGELRMELQEDVHPFTTEVPSELLARYPHSRLVHDYLLDCLKAWRHRAIPGDRGQRLRYTSCLFLVYRARVRHDYRLNEVVADIGADGVQRLAEVVFQVS